jgi:precorrin-2/cobalt-factor-2 C20-methyltransferase
MSAAAPHGTFYVVGMGPGDPDLVTLRAARIVATAPTIAYFAKRGQAGHAHRIGRGLIGAAAEELRFEYPFTIEVGVEDPRYAREMALFYDGCGTQIEARLDMGRDVALLCEGDPFFYGSSMQLFDRLGADHPSEIVPGVTGMSACWARAHAPIAHGDDVLTILPGTLDEDSLAARLAASDAAVIMKVGRNLGKIRAALRRAGRADRAIYVERGCMEGERILPLAELGVEPAPYFSLILVPGRQRRR